MSPWHQPSFPAILADGAYVAALALFLTLQHVGFRLRAHEADTWWSSNGRDVLNAAAVAGLAGAIALQGVAPHLALLFGATLTLVLSLLHLALLGRVQRPGRIVVLAAIVAGAPLVLAPGPCARAAARLVSALLPELELGALSTPPGP